MADTYTFDRSTNIGKIRVLITDTDINNAIYADEDIDVFLDLCDSDIFLSAAEALDTMAINESMVSKKINMLGTSTDGPAVANSLMKRAEMLRQIAYENMEAGIEIIQTISSRDDFNWRKAMENSYLISVL